MKPSTLNKRIKRLRPGWYRYNQRPYKMIQSTKIWFKDSAGRMHAKPAGYVVVESTQKGTGEPVKSKLELLPFARGCKRLTRAEVKDLMRQKKAAAQG